jgi:hypothetical protein
MPDAGCRSDSSRTRLPSTQRGLRAARPPHNCRNSHRGLTFAALDRPRTRRANARTQQATPELVSAKCLLGLRPQQPVDLLQPARFVPAQADTTASAAPSRAPSWNVVVFPEGTRSPDGGSRPRRRMPDRVRVPTGERRTELASPQASARPVRVPQGERRTGSRPHRQNRVRVPTARCRSTVHTAGRYPSVPLPGRGDLGRRQPRRPHCRRPHGSPAGSPPTTASAGRRKHVVEEVQRRPTHGRIPERGSPSTGRSTSPG